MQEIISNKILGFDFGAKYIGVALGQTITKTARPLTSIVIKNNQINWQEIEQLIITWQPGQLVVGVPVDLAGKKQHTTFACLKFLQQLKKRYNLPVHQADERLTTWEAKQKLSLQHKEYLSKQEIKKVNAMAAAILLEQWILEN